MSFRSLAFKRCAVSLSAVFLISACTENGRPIPLSGVEVVDIPVADVDDQSNQNINNPTLEIPATFEVSPGDTLTLVWSEEFDGTRIDPETWFFATGDGSEVGLPGGWGNNELQYYLPDSAQVENGILSITARRELAEGHTYTSARINTEDRFAVKYGRIEASIKLPAGQGLWPAFWMLPQDTTYGTWAASGEIDIVEAINLDGSGSDEIFGTLHFGGEFPANSSAGTTYAPSADITSEFHTYSIEWDEIEIRWYFDDTLYAVQNAWSSTAAPYPAPFDQPFHILLNVAVGGNFPGSPDANTVFPATMEVDWVRVYSGEDVPAGPTEPVVAAPTPTEPAGNVISVFSDAYTDIAGVDYNPDWGQATVTTQVDIAGDNTLKLAGLNYQGIDFTGNPQDVSGMENLHLDFWTADSTALNVFLISSGGVETAYALSITPNTWVSTDILLTEFAGVDLTDVIQFKFDGNGTIFLDNLYFSGGGGTATEPVVAAPTPTEAAGNVISLFSDAYVDIAGIDYNPNWGQATVATQVDIAGDNTLKFAGLNYQGIDFTGNAQDVSGMESLHLDFWTADSTALNVFLISTGPVEAPYTLTVMPNTWVSVDIPLTAFAGVDLADIIQLKFDGNGTVFLDNLYFTNGGGQPATEPVVAAPTPTADAVNVISLFSDAYTDIAGVDYNPNWGQATVVTTETIAGNDTLKYAGLNYQGTDFTGNAQDVSGMDSLHLDFWTADSTALNVSLISTGPVETAYALTITPHTWVSVDIPLTAFAGVDLADIIQLKVDGNGTIWLDNLYFESSGPPPTEPVTAAPTPTEPEANVISLFSDAYTAIAGIDYNPNWGQATVVTVENIAGSDVLKYAGLNYQGTDFTGNAQDVSAMTSLHVDFWTADSTALNVSLISTGPVETAYALTITPHTWVSVDIPLTAFAGVDLTDVIQLKVDGDGTVFLDNIYFSPAGGGGGPGPGGELAVNGDVETGDLSGWTTFLNGGTIEVVADNGPSAAGSSAINLNVTIPGNPTLKQANVGAGSLTPGQQVTVSFDWKGTDAAGGVVDAVLYSELAAGGVSQTDQILSGAGFPANWTTVGPLNINIGPDVSGGITFQLTAICGGVAGCVSDILIDNVSITVPVP